MNTAIYNNLLTTFTPKPLTKYDTHKASELRSIVGKIAKLTQNSPKYMVKLSDVKQTYALGIKESAMLLQSGLEELKDDTESNVFARRKAYSSDRTKVAAEITSEEYDKLPGEFSMKVDQLATTQVNAGKEYYTTGRGPEAGTYHFQVNVADDYYDFQYNVKKDCRHKELLEGLSSFINKANIGLKTEVVSGSKDADKIYMRLESTMTGSAAGERIFNLVDKEDKRAVGLVDYYQLNDMVKQPQSAIFSIGGEEKRTLSNEFTIGKSLKIDLLEETEDEVLVKYRPDSESIMDGIQKVLDAYNYMVESTHEYGKTTSQPLKLISELENVVKGHQSELESCGIHFDEERRLVMDSSLAIQAVDEGDMQELFGKDSSFVTKMIHKMDEIKLNPMNYVEKTLLCYPNYNKAGVGSAYVTSLYSGMLFNGYC